MKLKGSGLVPYVLLAFGAVIGVVVASDLGWMSSGSAGPDSRPDGLVYPVATAPQQPVTGGTAKSFVEIAKIGKACSRQHRRQPKRQGRRRSAKLSIRRPIFPKIFR